MKKSYLLFISLAVIAISAYAANHVNRSGTSSILSTGGTTTTNGKTVLVTEDSSTNEYSLATITATVSGNATTYSNTFSSAYLAAPVVIKGTVSGQNAGFGAASVVTVSSTSITITALSTNGSATNSVPFILYGYKRSGVFE